MTNRDLQRSGRRRSRLESHWTVIFTWPGPMEKSNFASFLPDCRIQTLIPSSGRAWILRNSRFIWLICAYPKSVDENSRGYHPETTKTSTVSRVKCGSSLLDTTCSTWLVDDSSYLRTLVGQGPTPQGWCRSLFQHARSTDRYFSKGAQFRSNKNEGFRKTNGLFIRFDHADSMFLVHGFKQTLGILAHLLRMVSWMTRWLDP